MGRAKRVFEAIVGAAGRALCWRSGSIRLPGLSWGPRVSAVSSHVPGHLVRAREAAPPASEHPPPPRPACSPRFQNGLAPRAGPARTPAVSQARAGWGGSGLGSARGLAGAPVEPPKGVGHQQPTCPWTWTPLLGPGANGPLLFKPGCVKLLSPLTGSVSATTIPWAALSRAGMRWHGLLPQGPPLSSPSTASCPDCPFCLPTGPAPVPPPRPDLQQPREPSEAESDGLPPEAPLHVEANQGCVHPQD